MTIPLVGNTVATNQIMAQQQYATPDKEAGETTAGAQTSLAGTSKPAEVEQTSFLEQFKLKTKPAEVQKPTSESLRSRLADIRRQSTELRKYPLAKAVKNYIADVKDFLSDLNEHAYAANKEGEYFQNIEIVDAKLDEMAETILAEEQDALALAASLGELEGLLIDIYV